MGVFETPELGRLDNENVCGRLAEARNAGQDVEALTQVRVCVAQHFEVFVDRFDLAIDLAQPLSELTLDEGRDGETARQKPKACRRTGFSTYEHGEDKR